MRPDREFVSSTSGTRMSLALPFSPVPWEQDWGKGIAMTRLLYLLRKCKTDANGSLSKHQEQTVCALAGHMQRCAIKPSVVVCPSLRGMAELLKLLTPALGTNVRILQEEWMKKAAIQDLFAYLPSIDHNKGSIMLVAGRRDIKRIVRHLTDHAHKTRMHFDSILPPLSLAVMEFDCDQWTEGEPGRGQLSYVYRDRHADYLNNDYFRYYNGKHDYRKSFHKYFSAKYVIDMLEAVWGALPPYSLLDAGSANGMTLAAFARKNIDAWGIENSPFIHSQTHRKWRTRNLLGDIVELPFPDKNFDFVYETCLCYVAEWDVDRAIRELSRVTRRGVFFGSIVQEMGKGTAEDWKDTFYGIKTLLNLPQWSKRFLANGFRNAVEDRQILSHVWKIEKQANNNKPWYPNRESMRYCFYTPSEIHSSPSWPAFLMAGE